MLKIRKLKKKDFKQVYRLIKSSNETDFTTIKSYFDKNFLKKVNKEKTALYLVALENSKIVGVLIAVVWKYFGISYLEMIFVDQNLRGKNIGKSLIKKYLTEMKNRKIKYIWALAKKGDKDLEKFSKNFGMKKRGIFDYFDLEL